MEGDHEKNILKFNEIGYFNDKNLNKTLLFRKMIIRFFRFYGDVIWGNTAKRDFRLGWREGGRLKIAAGAYNDLNCYFTHNLL